MEGCQSSSVQQRSGGGWGGVEWGRRRAEGAVRGKSCADQAQDRTGGASMWYPITLPRPDLPTQINMDSEAWVWPISKGLSFTLRKPLAAENCHRIQQKLCRPVASLHKDLGRIELCVWIWRLIAFTPTSSQTLVVRMSSSLLFILSTYFGLLILYSIRDHLSINLDNTGANWLCN